MKVMKNKNQNNHHESLCEFCICKHLKQMIVFFQYFDEIILVHLVTISYATQPTVNLKENLLVMMKMHLITSQMIELYVKSIILKQRQGLQQEVQLCDRLQSLGTPSIGTLCGGCTIPWLVPHTLSSVPGHQLKMTDTTELQ